MILEVVKKNLIFKINMYLIYYKNKTRRELFKNLNN